MPTSDLPDGKLVQQYRQGRIEAFDVLFGRYRDRLLGYLERCTNDPMLVEDLAQETVLRALKYADSFDPELPLWPWLKTAARRVAIDHWRERAERADSFEHDRAPFERQPGEEDHVDRLVLSEEQRSTLQPLLRQLSERHQTALRLRYMGDWSTERVAEYLGLDHNACNQLMFRAREAARREHERIEHQDASSRRGSRNGRDGIRVIVAGGDASARTCAAALLSEHHMRVRELDDLTFLRAVLEHPVATVLLSGGPPSDELELWRQLRSRPGSARAAVLVDHFRGAHEFTIYRGVGIQGFVCWNSPVATLLQAVRTVATGENYTDPEVPRPADPYELTSRQLEVLAGLKLFASDREIAELLFVSRNTVKDHFKQICRKMAVTGRQEMRYVALCDGLLGTQEQVRSSRTAPASVASDQHTTARPLLQALDLSST